MPLPRPATVSELANELVDALVEEADNAVSPRDLILVLQRVKVLVGERIDELEDALEFARDY